MKIYSEKTLLQFKAWSGGYETQKRIIEEGKWQEFDSLIEEEYPDGINEYKLNDILRFDSEWVFKALGIKEETED